MSEHQLYLPDGDAVRRIWHEGVLYFSIIDAIQHLTGSQRPSKYWNDLKRKLKKEGFTELSEKIGKLGLQGADGKKYPTDVADIPTLLRIIQSIPSPKVEPFKQWLSQVGYDRLNEDMDPEMGFERIRQTYRQKGYPEDWIETRLRSLDVRKQLTDEWKARGVNEQAEYAILTAEIAKATFGLTPSAHKGLKGLDKHNLRDHMTNLELIFSMLGEEATRQIAIRDDAQGFLDNHEAAAQGGALAGEARENFEIKGQIKVVSADNFLKQIADAQKEGLAGSSPEMPPQP